MEIDEVLSRVVDQAERHELAESSVMAFALALDQAQLAISERRAELTGHQPFGALRSGPARLQLVRGEGNATLDAT